MIFDILTGAEGSTTAGFTDIVIIEKDRKILRALATRMAELAGRRIEEERKNSGTHITI